MNSVNILNFYVQRHYTPHLELLCNHGNLQNLIDTDGKHASNYLLEQNNFEGLKNLFFSYLSGNLNID